LPSAPLWAITKNEPSKIKLVELIANEGCTIILYLHSPM
jgi:hypothetical protein